MMVIHFKLLLGFEKISAVVWSDTRKLRTDSTPFKWIVANR